MSAVTMSGEASPPRPADVTGQVHVAPGSPAKTETINATQQPAAVIAQSLERLNASGADKVVDRNIAVSASRVAVESDVRVDVEPPTPINLNNPSMSMLAEQAQAQIASVAEIAVLAQANQLPNDALPFSASA